MGAQANRDEIEFSLHLYDHIRTNHPNPVIPINQLSADICHYFRVARSLRKLYEEQCNRELRPFEVRHIAGLQAHITEVFLSRYGLRVTINSDPRGCSIYIHFPNGGYNTMGGAETGWGI